MKIMAALPRFEEFSMQTARLLLAPPRKDGLPALAGLWLEIHGKGGNERQQLFKFIAKKTSAPTNDILVDSLKKCRGDCRQLRI
jgi:hypothetical protein